MSNRPTAPPDPKPTRLLRLHLVQARDAGLTFDEAWERAVIRAAGADRSWKDAFAWSREEWRSCYERRPATPSVRAFEVLQFPGLGGGYDSRPPDAA
jgi:hypothetical protein